jgi:hypothetical protein
VALATGSVLFTALGSADDGVMNNHVPLSILFALLVAAVVPLALGFYLHGQMNLAAVLKNAFG